MKQRQICSLFIGAFALGLLSGCGDSQESASNNIFVLDPEPNNEELNNGESNNGSAALQLLECGSEDNPLGVQPPSEDLELEMMRFELKSETIRTVEGQLINKTNIAQPRGIEKAFLIGTGGFLHDGCIVRQNAASYSWEGAACQLEEGTLFNVLVISGEFNDAISRAEIDTSLRFQGYEVERLIDVSPGGGFWMDGGDNGSQGQTTFWLTNVCTLPATNSG